MRKFSVSVRVVTFVSRTLSFYVHDIANMLLTNAYMLKNHAHSISFSHFLANTVCVWLVYFFVLCLTDGHQERTS